MYHFALKNSAEHESYSFSLFSAESIFGEFDLFNFDNLSSAFDWDIEYIFNESSFDSVWLNLTKIGINGGGIGGGLDVGLGGGLTPNRPSTEVPEPSTFIMFFAALALLGVRRAKGIISFS